MVSQLLGLIYSSTFIRNRCVFASKERVSHSFFLGDSTCFEGDFGLKRGGEVTSDSFAFVNSAMIARTLKITNITTKVNKVK